MCVDERLSCACVLDDTLCLLLCFCPFSLHELLNFVLIETGQALVYAFNRLEAVILVANAELIQRSQSLQVAAETDHASSRRPVVLQIVV